MRVGWCRLLLVAPALVGPLVRAHAQGVVTRDVDYMVNVDYANGHDRLDVYMPRDAHASPVVVFFHGGALMAGDKSQGQSLASRLVPLGIGVVSADYRLSPTVQHPEHVRDAAAATAWVLRHIHEYGGDPSRVFVSGHSAGAYLATLLALDATLLAEHGIDTDSVRGTIAISPFLYVEETARDRPKTVWGEDPRTWVAASVSSRVGPSEARLLLIYADGDDEWRRAQNERFGREMREAGALHVVVTEVPNRDHRSLITLLTAEDDRIGELVRQFVEGGS